MPYECVRFPGQTCPGPNGCPAADAGDRTTQNLLANGESNKVAEAFGKLMQIMIGFQQCGRQIIPFGRPRQPKP